MDGRIIGVTDPDGTLYAVPRINGELSWSSKIEISKDLQGVFDAFIPVGTYLMLSIPIQASGFVTECYDWVEVT